MLATLATLATPTTLATLTAQAMLVATSTSRARSRTPTMAASQRVTLAHPRLLAASEGAEGQPWAAAEGTVEGAGCCRHHRSAALSSTALHVAWRGTAK